MLDSPLNQEMRCTLLTNVHGDIIVAHDTPLRENVEWVEFNENDLTFTIIYEDGLSQALGIKIRPKIVQNIAKGKKVQFAMIVDKKITKVQKANIIIQDY